MSRYYLHLRDFEGALLKDEDGSEFANLAVAKEQAMISMHELMGEAIKRGDQLQIEAIVVADEHGSHLAAVPVLAALPTAIVDLLKHPNKVIPPNKFEEYRRNADDCRRKAEDTADADDKNSWLKLADAWLQMLPLTHVGAADLAGWPKASDEDSKATH